MKASSIEREELSVLTGFNANIDHIYDFDAIDVDLESVESELMERVEGPEELKQVLSHCVETGENVEVLGRYMAKEFPEANRQLGGQGGIIAEFMNRTGNYSIFYTPFLSKELADMMSEEIVYPVIDSGLKLKRIKDAVNTDRTKENMIVEIDGEKTCRMIVSDRLEGFGPYFRKGIEERIETLDRNIDAAVLSGFHDADGNFSAKIDKAEIQIGLLNTPAHLEYVDMQEKKSKKILRDLLPEFDSVGLDENEALEVAEIKGMDVEDELSLGEAFQLSKRLLEDVDRVHIHTYRYHVVFADDYDIRPEKIRESMLYAENCAIAAADTGELPDTDDLRELGLEGKHLHRLDDLEDFAHHLGLEDFVETGIADINDITVVAIPTLIHEDPERVVGLGDIISSAAFTAELG